MTFGDDDPEDAYDASDSLEWRVELAGRTIRSIFDEQHALGTTARVHARITAARRIVTRIFDDLDEP